MVDLTDVLLITCTRRKAEGPAPARDLYVSPLFKSLVNVAESWSQAWCVISAKHGILRPDEIVEPYDFTLEDLSQAGQEIWAHDSLQKLINENPHMTRIWLLANKTYCRPILAEARRRGILVFCPGQHMDDSALHRWAERACAGSRAARDLHLLYELLSGFERLNLLRGKGPMKGLYFIVDPKERRLFSEEARIVRIGTHGVSRGSRSTLRQRIRSHLGSSTGMGSHRSSIFRLYVGRGLMNCGAVDFCESWASKTEDRPAEIPVEESVSRYLKSLRFIPIPVGGASSPTNDRAYLEANLIGLCSLLGSGQDCPSSDWLGLETDNAEVMASGLWNVNHVDRTYDPYSLELLAAYLDAYDRGISEIDLGLAPQNWLSNKGKIARQFELFNE